MHTNKSVSLNRHCCSEGALVPDATSHDPDQESPSIEVDVDLDGQDASCASPDDDGTPGPVEAMALPIENLMGQETCSIDDEEDSCPPPITRSWGLTPVAPVSAVVPELQPTAGGLKATDTIRPAPIVNETLTGVGSDEQEAVASALRGSSADELQDWLELLPNEVVSERQLQNRHSVTCPVNTGSEGAEPSVFAVQNRVEASPEAPVAGSLVTVAETQAEPAEQAAELAEASLVSEPAGLVETPEFHKSLRPMDSAETVEQVDTGELHPSVPTESLGTHAWDLVLQRADRVKVQTSDDVVAEAQVAATELSDQVGTQSCSSMTAWERAVARVRIKVDKTPPEPQESTSAVPGIEQTETLGSQCSAFERQATQSPEEQAALSFAEGYEALRARDYDRALELWQRAVRLDPEKRRYELNLRRLEQIIVEKKEKSLENA